MRYFLSLLIVSSFTMCVYAQNRLKVVLKNGNTITYNLDDIDCLMVDVAQQTETSDTVDMVGGTIGIPVEMGLSVKWADHNVGAVRDYNRGVLLTHDDALRAAELWGDGWRLPTKEEWEELLEKCDCKWTLQNGVAGRVFRSPDGTTLFIPFPGFGLMATSETQDVRRNTFSTGAIGIYWSSTPDTSSRSENIDGMYMDSGNLYSLGFTRTLKCGVRLVKD